MTSDIKRSHPSVQNNILLPHYEQTQQLEFIFDDEIMISSDMQSLEGYLIATDSLVARLYQHERIHLTSEQMECMENINFYPVYDVQNNIIGLEGHYYINDGFFATGRGFSLPLNMEESQHLISAFQSYCQNREGKTCISLLNEIRAEEGMAPLCQISLDTQISIAKSKTSATALGTQDQKGLSRTFEV